MDQVREKIKSDLPSIEGWCHVEKSLYMVDLIEKNNLNSYIELGVYCGRSLFPVALTMKHLHQNPLVIGVDSWNLTNTLQGTPDPQRDVHRDSWWSRLDHNGLYLYTINLMKKYGLDRTVQLYRTSSLDYVQFVDPQSIGMLHQDGNHSTEISLNEVNAYYDKVKIGGFWVFDDTDWSSTQPAQDKLVSYGYTCIHDASGWKVFERVR